LARSLIQVKQSMSNVGINIQQQQQDDGSSRSSFEVQIIPGGSLTASSSDSEPTTEERERRCIIEVRVKTQLSREWTQAKGVGVR